MYNVLKFLSDGNIAVKMAACLRTDRSDTCLSRTKYISACGINIWIPNFFLHVEDFLPAR
jgi:hypothetical protein